MSARLLSILGVAANPSDSNAGTAGHDDTREQTSKFGSEVRRELLMQIVDFIIDHDLDTSPANLLAAHAAFTGSDPGLARKINARQLSGGRIDQAWLDEQFADSDVAAADRESELDALMDKLNGSIESFSATTRTARKAAASYNAEMELHVEQAEATDATSEMIANLASVAKAMLDRTRHVEEEMKRSEQEATKLRKSLEKAQRNAEIDHLTGLPNRRAFEGLLETHYRQAQSELDNLCVAFCDIDHFKRINDTHGHETGDRVIQAIGQVLARVSDENCHVARHGGEEFVMLFRGLNKSEALEKLDLARETMAARKFVNRSNDEPIGQITFSGGIADVFSYPSSRDALRAADEALYRAKQSGRNRIELA